MEPKYVVEDAYNGINNGGLVKTEYSEEYCFLDPVIPQPNNSVVDLLKLWKLPELCEIFQNHQIDLECLTQITVSDIDALIPIDLLHLRIKFKASLAKWRIEKGYPSGSIAETLTRSTYLDPQIANFINVPERAPEALTSSSSIDESESIKIENLDIETMLSSCSRGKNIMRSADSEAKPLSSSQRKQLILIICDYCIEKNIPLGTDNCEKLSMKIQKRFPQESKECYFVRASASGRARGPLYSCYNNRMKYLRKKGFLKPYKKRSESHSSELESTQSDVQKMDADNDQNWLSCYSEPWHIVEAKWNSTFSVRRLDILSKPPSDVFIDWPLLGNSKALCLIELDFVSTYTQDISFYLKGNWNIFSEKILEVCTKKARYSKYVTDLVKRAKDENITKDEKDKTIFLILHHLLPLSHKLKIEENETKERYRHALIKGSIDSCILKVNNQNDILIEYRKLQKTKLSTSMQPIIVDCLSQYYLVYGNVVHKVDIFLSGLDYLFKVFNVLNIDYPSQSINFWNFIQAYFYGTECKTTIADSVLVLMHYLNY